MFTSREVIVSDRTDAFMFGCFMFEVITAREPWYWLPPGELMSTRCASPPRNPLDDAIANGKFEQKVSPAFEPTHPVFTAIRMFTATDVSLRASVGKLSDILSTSTIESTYLDGYGDFAATAQVPIVVEYLSVMIIVEITSIYYCRVAAAIITVPSFHSVVYLTKGAICRLR